MREQKMKKSSAMKIVAIIVTIGIFSELFIFKALDIGLCLRYLDKRHSGYLYNVMQIAVAVLVFWIWKRTAEKIKRDNPQNRFIFLKLFIPTVLQAMVIWGYFYYTDDPIGTIYYMLYNISILVLMANMCGIHFINSKWIKADFKEYYLFYLAGCLGGWFLANKWVMLMLIKGTSFLGTLESRYSYRFHKYWMIGIVLTIVTAALLFLRLLKYISKIRSGGVMEASQMKVYFRRGFILLFLAFIGYSFAFFIFYSVAIL